MIGDFLIQHCQNISQTPPNLSKWGNAFDEQIWLLIISKQSSLSYSFSVGKKRGRICFKQKTWPIEIVGSSFYKCKAHNIVIIGYVYFICNYLLSDRVWWFTARDEDAFLKKSSTCKPTCKQLWVRYARKT